MTSQAAPALRVLMLGRSDELAVEILTGLQDIGYRTVCEQVGDLAVLSLALGGKAWDVVVCLSAMADERRDAARLCERAQPGLLFAAVSAPVDMARLATLIKTQIEGTPCRD